MNLTLYRMNFCLGSLSRQMLRGFSEKQINQSNDQTTSTTLINWFCLLFIFSPGLNTDQDGAWQRRVLSPMRHLAHPPPPPPPPTYPYVNKDVKKCRICVILLGFRFWLITSKLAKAFFTIQIAQYEITLDSRCALFRYSSLFNIYFIFPFLYLRLCFPKNPFWNQFY